MSVKRVIIAFAFVLAMVATGGGAVSTVAASDAGTDDCTTPQTVADSVTVSVSDSDVGTDCSGGGGCTLWCGP